MQNFIARITKGDPATPKTDMRRHYRRPRRQQRTGLNGSLLAHAAPDSQKKGSTTRNPLDRRLDNKRLFRVYRAAGLSVQRKKRKRLARVGQPSFTPTRPNEQWAIDFVQDRMANGRTMRILSIIDTFTRECLALEVDTCLPSRRVTRALDGVIAERGRPERIRMDNGSELTSRHFLAWGIDQRIELVHIQPGKPVQNAYVESFHGRLRDECLNTQWFRNLWHARRQIGAWRHEFNHDRPHSSLDYRTPHQFAQACLAATASSVTQ